MARITIKNLQSVCDRINRMTGAPMEPYAKDEGGRYVAQIGSYHISRAYGGFALHRIENESGGVSDVFSSGHVPSRELYAMMRAYIAGYTERGGDK